MKFFQRQRVDDMGVLGVKLQKIILFLIFSVFLSIATSVGFSFWLMLCHLIDLIVLWTGFHGAHKKNDKALRLYVIYHVTVFTLILLGLLFALLFPVGVENRDQVSDDSSLFMSLQAPQKNPFVPIAQPDAQDLNPEPKELQNPQPKELQIPEDTVPLHDIAPIVSTMPARVNGTLVFIDMFLFVFFLIAFILRMVSIIVASRLAKMIRIRRAQHLAHPVNRKVEEVVYEAPEPQMSFGYAQPPVAQPGYYNPYMMQPYFVNQQMQQYYMMQQMQQPQQQTQRQ